MTLPWVSMQVDPELLASAAEAFATTLRPHGEAPGKVFSPDFGARKMEKELAILDMPERKLVPAWEACVRAALSARIAVEEEIEKSRQAQVRNPSFHHCVVPCEKRGWLVRFASLG